MKPTCLNSKLSPFAAIPAIIALTLVLFGPTCARAQANPSTSNVVYKLLPSLSGDNSTLTLTISAANTLAPSIAAQSFTFNATTNETPARSFTATATVPATNDLLNGPVVTIPIQQATNTLAGLTPPAALPSGVAIAGNILTWNPGKLEGGATATVAVTFQIAQPTGGQLPSGNTSGSHG